MKIALLLSGGVDSSTALRRLMASGNHQITAFYLKIWLEDDTAYMGNCPWEEDLEFAQAVCDAAGVPLEIVPLQLEYYDKVVSYALAELKAGRTPSPDIFCNQRIKFGAFIDHLRDKFDKIASGHYAQVDWVPSQRPLVGETGIDAMDPEAGQGKGRWRLLRAPDRVKDQTYFLSHLSQGQMAQVLFPIGDLEKSRVRSLAIDYDLANKDRPDSQGICFLGKIRYPDFVRHYLGEQDGPIVELETGVTLGRHRGYWFHTVGQRTGLGIGNGPWYVSAKDCRHNIVYASHGTHRAERERGIFEVAELTWLSDTSPSETELQAWQGNLQVKLRHGPHLTDCSLYWINISGCSERRLRVNLAKPDRGIAAGQFAVFYLGQECLGSGKIQELDQSELDLLLERHLSKKNLDEQTKIAADLEKQAKRRLRLQKYRQSTGNAL